MLATTCQVECEVHGQVNAVCLSYYTMERVEAAQDTADYDCMSVNTRQQTRTAQTALF